MSRICTARLAHERSPCRPSWRPAGGCLAQILRERGRHAARRHGMETLAVVGVEHSERRLAQPHRLFQHRIEHRRQIARRGVDHLQHLGGRGLLLQCLPLFGDQPRVLHRDHRLRREVFQQGDLLVGERPGFLAIDRDEAEQRLRPCAAAPQAALRTPPRSTSASRTTGIASGTHRSLTSVDLNRLAVRNACAQVRAASG